MMTETKQEGAKRRRHDPEFKKEPMRAWKTSGKTAAQLARELGAVPNMFFKCDQAERLPQRPETVVLTDGQRALETGVLRLRRGAQADH